MIRELHGVEVVYDHRWDSSDWNEPREQIVEIERMVWTDMWEFLEWDSRHQDQQVTLRMLAAGERAEAGMDVGPVAWRDLEEFFLGDGLEELLEAAG